MVFLRRLPDGGIGAHQKYLSAPHRPGSDPAGGGVKEKAGFGYTQIIKPKPAAFSLKKDLRNESLVAQLDSAVK
jgi:hypothetical protein